MSTIQPRNTNRARHERIPSVERALDILELLAYFRQELTLSELSRHLGIPKSTMHYLVSTMITRGCLQRRKDGHHFSLHHRISELAAGTSIAQSQLRTVCHPHMVSLVKKLNLTVLLAIREGLEVVTIAAVESSDDEGGGAWIGRHLELLCTAQGKVLIAYCSPRQIEELFRKYKPSVYAPKTVASLNALKAALREVRAKGYAVNDEEHGLGVRAVAAPIFNHAGTVVASLSLRALTPRIPVWRMELVGKEVASVAHQISRYLSDPIPGGIGL